MDLPVISRAESPYIRSAAGFPRVTMPSSVVPMMASSACSTIAASRSEWRRSAYAFVRAGISRTAAITRGPSSLSACNEAMSTG